MTVEKPLNEPGANFPMWKWQVCAVEALGLPGEELPRIASQEYIPATPTRRREHAVSPLLQRDLLKVRTPDVVYRDSVIYGVIHGAAGRMVALLRDEATVASQSSTAEETFRFTDLAAGQYVVAVDGTPLRSQPVRVNGQDQVQLDLTLILAESVIAGRCATAPAGPSR